MKTCIIIHILPQEIDQFEMQMHELNKNIKLLCNKDDEIVIDATLNINDSIVDWNKSKISKQYFIDRFNKTKNINKYPTSLFYINDDYTCQGVNDKRRSAIKKYSSNCNNLIYLDNDMFYPNITLKYMLDAAKSIKNKYYIISPQSTVLWSDEWNVLVNDTYKNIPHEQLLDIDAYEVFTKNYGEIEIVSMNDTFKFGGGWFNLFSTNLLEFVGIPDTFSYYGPDDTFLENACKIMKKNGIDVQQYLVKNLVVTQNHLDTFNNIYKNYIVFDVDKKMKMAENGLNYMELELKRFEEKVKEESKFNHN